MSGVEPRITDPLPASLAVAAARTRRREAALRELLRNLPPDVAQHIGALVTPTELDALALDMDAAARTPNPEP